MVNLTAWAQTVAGRYIDVDAWAGNQCWDLSQHWLTACNGGTLWTQPSNYPGLASGSWEVATQNTGNTADLLRHVTAHPGTDMGRPGDIVIWAYGSPHYPISHTAVLIEDRGRTLYCLSQNSSPARPDLPGYSPDSSGPSIYQDLPRDGILGFLRPRVTVTGQSSNITPIPTPKEDTLSAKEVETIMGAIASMESGIRQNIRDHFIEGSTTGSGDNKTWRPGATKLLIENQRRINAANAKLAALETVVGQLAKGQGVTIDYKKIDASIKAALAEGIEVTGTLTAKDGAK